MIITIALESGILFLATALALVAAGLAARRQAAPGSRSFLLLSLAVALWSFCDGLASMMPTTQAGIFFARLAYLGIASVPVLMLQFSLQYTRQARFLDNPWRMALLWLVPLLTNGLVWTNNLHHLVWARITALPGGPGFEIEYGPYFWANTVYSYGLLLIAFSSLLVAVIRFPNLYRRQAVALLGGALVPWVGNVIYLVFDNPIKSFDLTSLGFTIGASVYAWALFRYELFKLTPVARDILVESMSDAVLVVDLHGIIADTNPAAWRMLGQAPNQLVGRPVDQILPLPPAGFLGLVDARKPEPTAGPSASGSAPAKASPGLALLRRRPAPPLVPQLIDEELIYAEEPLVVLEMRASPVYNHYREHTGWLLVLRNVTERMRMESELRQARDTAEAASRFKSEFLANMSHEIRTPMNAVIGITTLLKDTRLDDEQRDWLDIVRTSSEALLAVINDILDYSRVESGKLPLEHIPFSLRATIEESLELVAVRAAEKELELLYQVDAKTPDMLVGDANRLRQVLVNLLNNAVKFTDQGEVVLNVYSGAAVQIAEESSVLEQEWTEVRFSIKDTGIGIAAEHIEQLFQPFSQVGLAARKNGGSGLGLAISKRLVEMMGGRVWVESEVGSGSSFSFTIWAPLATDTPPPASIPGVLNGKRILIIEPHPASLQFLVAIVEAAGMVALTAASAQAALALLARSEHTKRGRSAGSGRSLASSSSGRGSSLVSSAGTKPVVRSSLSALLEPVARQAISAIGGTPAEPAPGKIDLALVDRSVQDLEAVSAALARVPLVIMAMPGKHHLPENIQFQARLLKPVRPARLYQTLARCLESEVSLMGLALDVAGGPSVADPAVGAPISGPPADGSSVSRQQAAPILAAPGLAAPGPVEGLRILVAEDDYTNQRVLQLILNQMGYTSELAANGLEVMEILKHKVFDVILMDMEMPGLDGLDTTRLVRDNLPAERQPRIIAMTANAMLGDRERCLTAGMDDYLSKPVRNLELAGALSACQRLPVVLNEFAAIVAGDAQQPTAGSQEPPEHSRQPAALNPVPAPMLDNEALSSSRYNSQWNREREAGRDELLNAVRAEIIIEGAPEPAPAGAIPPEIPAASQPPDGIEDRSVRAHQLLEEEEMQMETDEDPTSPLLPGAIDRELLDNMINFLGPDGSQMVGEVIRLFARTTPDAIQQMDSAIQLGDLHVVQQVAHSLKSSSATLGALRLSRCASQLEAAARDARLDSNSTSQPLVRFEVMLDQLRAEFHRADTEFKDMGY